MLERDAKNANQTPAAKTKAPSKDAIISGLKNKVAELEMALEQLQQSPPLPSKEKMAEAMKRDNSLIPDFVKPQIPVPQQTAALKDLEVLLEGIVQKVDDAKKISARLKRGIRTPPIGR